MGVLVLDLFEKLDKFLEPILEENDSEDKVFLHKTKADYSRYMAEAQNNEKYKEDAKKY